MLLFDTVLIGYYLILDHTIYLQKKNDYFGARQHAQILAAFAHSIYLHIISNYIAQFMGHPRIHFWFFITICSVLFLAHYIIYSRRGRLNHILEKPIKKTKKGLSILFSLAYLVVGVILFLNR